MFKSVLNAFNLLLFTTALLLLVIGYENMNSGGGLNLIFHEKRFKNEF